MINYKNPLTNEEIHLNSYLKKTINKNYKIQNKSTKIPNQNPLYNEETQLNSYLKKMINKNQNNRTFLKTLRPNQNPLYNEETQLNSYLKKMTNKNYSSYSNKLISLMNPSCYLRVKPHSINFLENTNSKRIMINKLNYKKTLFQPIRMISSQNLLYSEETQSKNYLKKVI